MGGRGGSSGLYTSDKPVSKVISNVYFNSAKKNIDNAKITRKDSKLEKVIAEGNTDYFKRINTKDEAYRISDYIKGRISESNRKIVGLGSAEAVFKNQKVAIEHRKLITAEIAMREEMKRFHNHLEKGNTNSFYDPNRATTTYDRARKRRIQNFDSWFFGSNKK